jgi:serine/threonine protein kinase
MRSDAIKPGDVIAGKYRVRAILSRQRGYLVEAFHTEFDQRVVIRVLSPHLVDDKEVERFRREARTLAKLESEHVARIVDVGKTQDGAFYFARQYLEGQDLGTYLKQRGALPLAEAVLFILQAAEAVAETHVHSIILRELQPAHLFLTQRIGGQQVKVIDFGTAKLMRDAAAPTAGGELTATSMFGLSCYSSPELVRKAQHVDVRTDVWSLGAIVYQLLTARPPFAGEMAALMLAITRDDPVPLTRYRPDLPAELDNIVNWALAKDPDGRFANVHGFAHALLPFASSEGQLLIRRIGEITAAGKQRRQAAPAAPSAAMDRDHPITIDGSDLLEDDEDDQRTAYRSADAPVMSPGYHANVAIPQSQADGPPLEQTVFIAPPPVPAARPSQPAFLFEGRPAAEGPRPSQPAWQPMPVPLPPGGGPVGAYGQAGQQGQPAPAGSPPLALPAMRAAMATIQSPSVPSGFAAPGAKPPPKGQKLALAAVAGAVVLLSVVAVLVVFKSHPPADAVADATSAKAAASAAPGTPVGVAASGTPGTAAAPASADPVAPVATAEPAATTAAPVAVAPVAPPPANTGRVAVNTAKTATKGPERVPAPAPVPAPVPVPPAAGGGDNGTLVAVAVGGSCAFSVNGASKGTTSTLKMSVKPGTYSVTCAPSSGSAKSKSVTVSSGGTAMAMFKL